MKIYFNILFVLAYFSVFILGLLTCFHLVYEYCKNRKFIKAISVAILALCAIGGLIQAILGA